MPAMIRTSGHMWGPDGEEDDTLAVIPDSSLRRHLPGRHRRLPRPRRVRPGDDGLGAQRRADGPGRRGVRLPRQDVRDPDRRHGARRRPAPARCCSSTQVSAGDIWRACQTKDVPIRDWVKLAVTRARATGRAGGVLARRGPGPRRQPDRQGRDLPAGPRHRRASTSGSWRRSRRSALSLERIRRGEDTISVTGNVLRDYLTDLFPIMELGTSAKMLSVVPLINGGGLFETGAGGSAPKHVQQLVKENYLRWDSLGEFLALAVSFEQYATATGNTRAKVLADTLDRATGTFLDENKSPARRVGQIDNRGSHFYLALYWAEELAAQTDDPDLAATFAGLAKTLRGERGADRRRAARRPGPPGRPRRLLPPRPRQDDGRDAPVGDVQRGAWPACRAIGAFRAGLPRTKHSDARNARTIGARWTSTGPPSSSPSAPRPGTWPPTRWPASGASTTRGSTATPTSSPRRWPRSAGSA